MGRYLVFILVAGLTALSLFAAAFNSWFLIPFLLFSGFTILGIRDVVQPRHAILRNYPVIGHMRFRL